MVTRRVRGRQFLLRPDKRTNQLIRYVVAVMVQHWKLKLHAITAMSNHWHLCVTDPLGNIVKFQRDCHAFIARGLNASHGEIESVWSSTQTSRVHCEEPDDLVRKIAYTMANPVEAGLVRYGKSWPGVRHVWPRKPLVVTRPSTFFRGKDEGGRWPDEAHLVLERPPGYEDLSEAALAELIASETSEREDKIRKDFDKTGRKFLGRRAVLAQSRRACPASENQRFKLSPRVACGDKWRRSERLAADCDWLIAYERARKLWIAGTPGIVFPYGTYKLRVEQRVTCDPEPG